MALKEITYTPIVPRREFTAHVVPTSLGTLCVLNIDGHWRVDVTGLGVTVVLGKRFRTQAKAIAWAKRVLARVPAEDFLALGSDPTRVPQKLLSSVAIRVASLH